MNTRSVCRISRKDELITVCDFGNHNLCGSFPSSKDEFIPSASLSLGWSPSSNLLQLRDISDISEMYGQNYGYRSGLNNSMVNHLNDKVNYLTKKFYKKDISCVLDIGSNDGTLLSFYEKKIKRIGVDPTIKKFGKYYDEGIIKVDSFFDADTFLKSSGNQKADIITTISMFYDLPDPAKFVEDISEVLENEGIWNLEQSYMPSMLRTNSYDTVCHEHIEYYSLEVIKNLIEKYSLKIIDVVFNKINGGSFSIIVAHKNSKYESNKIIINWMLAQEHRMGLHTPNPYREFERKAYLHRSDLKELIGSICKNKQKVAGYGASTKGNVILQFCEFSTNELFGIAEINNDKFGKYTPGSKIPILSEKDIKSDKPDYMLVLPWHFRENIIKREKEYLKNGGKLIFPLPEIEIVG